MGYKKKLLGLIGYPLSHSFSQSYFQNKFSKNISFANYEYINFQIKNINELKNIIIEHPQLIGFNVTIPYKEQILHLLDKTDDIAQQIKAVNTVKIIWDNSQQFKLSGYNTDVYGFEQSIKPYLKLQHKKALILGTGGASKAVAHVLSKFGIDVLFVSRKKKDKKTITYSNINKELLNQYRIIVNTTPAGMFPDIDSSPDIPYIFINKEFLCYDLIYNPEKTKFLALSEKKGATIVNGYQMLVLQAEKAFEIFTNNII